jgi:hypothetical protein
MTNNPSSTPLSMLADKIERDGLCSAFATLDGDDEEALTPLVLQALTVSETAYPTEVERLKEALRQVKAFVVGEKSPNWHDDDVVYLTRGRIADICDIALAHPHHPRDLHLTVEKR